MTLLISAEQHRQFDDQGYFLLEDVFPESEMIELASHIEAIERQATQEIEARGGVDGISRVAEITFTSHLAERDPAIRAFVTRSEFVDITAQLLGADVDLYWDQSVFKKPEGEKEFPWHQDDGYAPVDPSPYLTIWLALNDATSENGCISVLPGSHKRGLSEHRESPIGFVCYSSDEPDQGVQVPVRAGSMAVFSSLTYHKSGVNSSGGTRKAYVIQYSHAGLRSARTGEVLTGKVPLARNGKPLSED